MPAEAASSGAPIIPIGLAAQPSPAPPEKAAARLEELAPGPRPMSPFNLRKPSLLTPGELRKLRMRHDEFVRSLATRLSIHLRLEIGVEILAFDTCFYPIFVERLSNPTQVALFNVKSLDGVGLLEIPPKLGIALVERLLGGPGKSMVLERDLSEIETALLDQVIELILKEWCQGVASISDGAPAIVGHETNPRFLQSASSDTSMLILALGLQLNDCTGKVHLGFPYPMLQPVICQLTPPLEAKKETATTPIVPLHWNTELDSVKIPLSAEWEGLEIDARQLAHLKVGDILPVDPECINRTAVHLARVPKFTGRLGKCGNAWAIQLMEKL